MFSTKMHDTIATRLFFSVVVSEGDGRNRS